MKSISLFLGLAVFLISSNLFAQTVEREFNYTFSLIEGGVVSVENANGDIRIKGWDQDRVEVKATKRGDEDVIDLVKIEIDSTPERLKIETVYPRFRKDIRVSVHYELLIPGSAVLDAIGNVNGDIEVRGIAGRMAVETVNGSILIEGSESSVKAQTVNGRISTAWARFPGNGSVRMQTVNGAVKLLLPEEAGAEVDASSMNGSIRTDFPITVRGGFLSRSLSGKIGSGGTRIAIGTINGSIEIRKASSDGGRPRSY
jgi:DUF4097 and DUF4098 domain-containing protein YvlB